MGGDRLGWDQILRWRELGTNPEDEIRHLQMSHDTLKDKVRDLMGNADSLDLALRAVRDSPPEIAQLVGRLARCPICGAAAAWVERSCCRLGQLVGQAEAKRVADVVMGEGA